MTPSVKRPQIVADPSGITPEWLTEVLAFGGQPGVVTGFSATSIGTGQVGENVRFVLEGDDVPGSVVGKFASRDPISKQTGIAQQNYVREVFFYNEVRSTVDVQTPRVLFADADAATHDFVIVMEDLSPGVQGDQLGGCGADDAAMALEQLARLQGPRWGDPALLSLPLLAGSYTPEAASQLQLFYKALLPGFLQRYAGKLASGHERVCQQTGEGLHRYQDKYDGPPGLIHIDYRLDNMMFGGPYPLAVVDWQSIATGCPIADASYFLGTSLLPALRAKEEEHLLRHYLDVLKSYDVAMKWDECFALYRNYAPAGLIMAVIASMIVGETERGNDMFMVMANRSSQMCLELESLK